MEVQEDFKEWLALLNAHDKNRRYDVPYCFIKPYRGFCKAFLALIFTSPLAQYRNHPADRTVKRLYLRCKTPSIREDS